MYKKFVKPTFDFFGALLGLLLLSPIFILIFFILIFINKGRPLYFHERPGKDSKLFKIIKFKSMNDKRDKSGKLLPFNNRLTKFGAFMRKYSLDEIPQLINVIKGDMSLVGPRPLIKEYLPIYNEVQSRRHEVKSGITGWAQINGRNSINWEKKFEYDLYYINNLSFLLDLKILVFTLYKVIKKDGVNASENQNMPAFGDIEIDI